MNYKLAQDNSGQDRTDVILGITDDNQVLWIPADPGNRDWSTYQAWLALGNEPLPSDSE